MPNKLELFSDQVSHTVTTAIISGWILLNVFFDLSIFKKN